MDFLKGKKLLQMEKDLVPAEVALKKKNLILYYFSSGHSSPCRIFDDRLREVYQEAQIRKMEIVVIIVSADPDLESFKNNMRSNYHDFYAIPYDDELQQYGNRNAFTFHYVTLCDWFNFTSSILMYNYGVTCTPTLIVVRRNGTVVTRDGKKDIDKIGINVLVTWGE